MAESLSLQKKLAVAAVDAAFAPNSERLDQGTLRRLYPVREASYGWRLTINFLDRARRLDLLADDGFPWTPLKIALVDRPPFLTWPHVEEDGLLCFLPSNASVDSSRPAAAAQALLGEACEMIEKLSTGGMEKDFENEFLSYWGRSSSNRLPPAYSLCATNGASRTIFCWRGESFTVLADTAEQLTHWLHNRFSAGRKTTIRIEPAILVALDRPPLPDDYPESGRELISYVERTDPDAAEAVKRLSSETTERLLVAFCARTANGPAFACVSIDRPQAPRWPGRGRSDPLTKGFRPEKLPSAIRSARFMGGKLSKRRVERADHTWVHGRDHDPHAAMLQGKTATFVGCGSLGAPVVTLLGRAGLGKLILIDPENLAWANVGRHVLGARDVGHSKAVALAQHLKTDLPHLVDIEAFPFRLERILQERPDVLSESDLIISTTGAWGPESLLSDWHASNGKRFPVIYGWAEAHACAGHAVAITNTGGCLRCGFDPKGQHAYSVTAWPEQTELMEPGCGAVFQPYGPIAMSNIAARVADLSLEFLVEPAKHSSRRTWIGQTDRIRKLGGEITAYGQRLLRDRPEGECVFNEDWPERCAGCSEAAVA